MKLLIVDDVADNRNLLAQILDEDYEVTLAANGREAIACIEQNRPDMVLLDLMMPVLDGFGVLAYLQAHSGPFLPVIVLTATTEREERLRALQAGAHDFLNKPVDDDELLARMATLLALKRSRDELSTAKQAAENAMRFKGMFLATMSHEIRTPLAAIIGFAETLHDHLREPAAIADTQRIILRNGRHLQHLINDILDIAKLESEGIEVEQIACNLFTQLCDVESIVGMQAKEKGLAFRLDYHFPLPTQITTDPTRFKQVLLNLCSNAVKFTEHGEVCMRIRCEFGSERLQVSISDTGIGMTDAQMAQLFQPFAQADASTTRRFGGTGLGLYISRQLATLLGGQLDVTSEPGRGSRFDLEVATGPIAGAAVALDLSDVLGTGEREAAVRIPTLSGRVLLAEDSADLRRLLTHFVRKTGASVEVAENGQVAVEMALAGEFDLILLDMNMPVMGGLEATDWLRRAGCMLPIVTVTANVLAEDVARYMKAGCTDCLAKPIDQELFYEVLSTHLSAGTDPPSRDTAGDDGIVALLGREFLAELPDVLLAFQYAARHGDIERLQTLAHRLRGTAASLGFAALGAAAGDIERHAQQQDREATLSAAADLIAGHGDTASKHSASIQG